MNCAELLSQLNEMDEHQTIEAKASRQMGDSLLETACAFANEPDLNGGYLLLGVARNEYPKDPPYKVIGVPDPDKLQADLASQCASVFNRPIRPSCWVETLDGKTVIGVLVPEAQPGDKPIYFKKYGLPRGAFRRIGSTDQRCTEDDLLVFYSDKTHRSFDETLVVDTDLKDIDSEAIAEYRRSRRDAYPNAEELSWTDAELLKALGCAKSTDGKLNLTLTGVVLFSNSSALRRLLPMTRVDYIRVPGREWITDPENPFETIEMRAPLMRLISRAMAAVLDDLPVAFSLPRGQLQRQESPLIPERVIREALVNALMHRSYRIHSPIQIIRYSNRIEIRNPGHSLVSPDRLGEPGSKTRNPHIAAVLHDTRFAENKGSGIRVMKQLMNEANLTPPAFDSDRDKDEFVVTLLFHHLLGESDISWLARFKDDQLNDDDARILIFAREKGSISNTEGRNLTGLDTLKVSFRLRRLRDFGLLKKHDHGSATYYTPTDILLGVEHAPTSQGSRQVSLLSLLQRERDRERLKQKPECLTQKLNILTHKSERLTQKLETIPPELIEATKKLGRRSPPRDVQHVILGFCREQPFTADELAELLGRKRAWVTRSYLTAMLQDGQLEYTIPGNPRHPRQAYRTARKGTQ